MNKARRGDGILAELFQSIKDNAVKLLHSKCQQIWKTQQYPQDWKRSVFMPIPKKGNAKECSNHCTIVLISHASKVMLKIPQAREFQQNIYFCFMDYAKSFDCVDHNKLWKILKEIEIADHLTCLLRNLYVAQEAIVKTDMEHPTGSKLGREYYKAVYCHPAYLTYTQSTSCKILGWRNHKLESS